MTEKLSKEQKVLVSSAVAGTIERLAGMQVDLFKYVDCQPRVHGELLGVFNDLQEVERLLTQNQEPLTFTEANFMRELHTLLRKRGDGPAEQLLYSFHARDYGRKVFTAFCRILLKIRSVGDCLDNLKHDYDLISTREDREMLYALQINEGILYDIWKDIKDHPLVNPKES